MLGHHVLCMHHAHAPGRQGQGCALCCPLLPGVMDTHSWHRTETGFWGPVYRPVKVSVTWFLQLGKRSSQTSETETFFLNWTCVKWRGAGRTFLGAHVTSDALPPLLAPGPSLQSLAAEAVVESQTQRERENTEFSACWLGSRKQNDGKACKCQEEKHRQSDWAAFPSCFPKVSARA